MVKCVNLEPVRLPWTVPVSLKPAGSIVTETVCRSVRAAANIAVLPNLEDALSTELLCSCNASASNLQVPKSLLAPGTPGSAVLNVSKGQTAAGSVLHSVSQHLALMQPTQFHCGFAASARGPGGAALLDCLPCGKPERAWHARGALGAPRLHLSIRVHQGAARGVQHAS